MQAGTSRSGRSKEKAEKAGRLPGCESPSFPFAAFVFRVPVRFAVSASCQRGGDSLAWVLVKAETPGTSQTLDWDMFTTANCCRTKAMV